MMYYNDFENAIGNKPNFNSRGFLPDPPNSIIFKPCMNVNINLPFHPLIFNTSMTTYYY